MRSMKRGTFAQGVLKNLAAVLFVFAAILPSTTLAENVDPCVSLPGTLTVAADGFYEIGTDDALYKFACMVNNGTTDINGRLTADICVNACGEGESVLGADGALNGTGGNFKSWTPMDVPENATVKFNGAGHTISGLFHESYNFSKLSGLFGVVQGSVSIDSLGVVDSYFRGEWYTGGLVGGSNGNLTITNSYNKGSVNGNIIVGGLVGFNDGTLTITNSYNAGVVSGGYAGGLVGGTQGASTITNSYNTGIVSGIAVDGGFCAGGLVGNVIEGTLTITNCYNTGTVSGTGNAAEVYVGGLVGYNKAADLTITHSFFLETEGHNGCGFECGDYSGTAEPEADFLDGLVASDLHNYSANGVDGSIWGQDLAKKNTLPDFSGKVGTPHSLTLHSFEGDTRKYPTEYTQELDFDLPTDLVRKGYIFVGWSSKQVAESMADMAASIAKGETEDKEFYAQWLKSNDVGCYEIASVDSLYKFAFAANAIVDGELCGVLADNIVVNENVLKEVALNGAGTNFKLWTPMNVNEGAKLTLDGNGKTISGLYFKGNDVNDVGLFGKVDGIVTISDLGIVDSYFEGNISIGAFLGSGGAKTTIKNSFNAGTVRGSVNVGGLVGGFGGELNITGSYNSGSVNGTADKVGGFVGHSNGTLNITQSYNTAFVSGTAENVGGLVGLNDGALNITQSYNTVSVIGAYYVGGLVGNSSETFAITNSYNAGSVIGTDAVGGFVGYVAVGRDVSITESFFLATDGVKGCGRGCNADSKLAHSGADFRNGTVAKELQLYNGEDGVNGSIWGQDLRSAFSLPDFSGKIVSSLTLHTFEGDTHEYPTEYVSEKGFELPANLEREGYTFVGWSTKRVAESSADKVTSIAKGTMGHLEFYAQWREANGCEKTGNLAMVDGIYQIGTCGDLYKFAEIVGAASNAEISGKLTDDIVVNDLVLEGVLNDGQFTPWTPMNVKSGVQVMFNGAGHVIGGLYFNDYSGQGVGLFGNVQGTVSIDSLGIVDSYFNVKGAVDHYIGSVGGLVGSSYGTLTITNSYNMGAVSGDADVGGLVGFNDGTLSITNSYNAGSVSGDGIFSNVSGLVGSSYGTLTITNSYNAGAVSGSYDVGGLVGYVDGENVTLSITNSYNAGSVSGSYYVGGLVGYAFGENVTLSITNSYNAGSVSGDSNVGGLVGGSDGTLTVTNSFFLATGKDGVNYGGTETSLEDFHKGAVAFQLHDWCEKDGDVCKEGGLNGSVWGQDLNDANSLPDFSGSVGHKYGSIVFFYGEDDKIDSAHVDAASELAVDFPNNVVVSGPIKFKRTFAGGGYSTIMLPFTPNCSNNDCVEGVNFYAFSNYENATVGVSEVSPSALQANTPYLVQAAGAAEIVFKNGGTFNTTTGDAYDSETGLYKKVLAGEGAGWTIYGTYAYKQWNAGDAGIGSTYGFAANDGVNDPAIVGEFRKVGAGAYIYPMRAYLEYVEPSVTPAPRSMDSARRFATPGMTCAAGTSGMTSVAGTSGMTGAAGTSRMTTELPEEIRVVVAGAESVDENRADAGTMKVIGTINTRTGEFKFANDRWFDLQGRYLGSKKPTQKGAYYNNGKKVIVK